MSRTVSATMAIAALVCILAAVPARAAGPKTLGAFGEWSAHALSGSAEKTCYAHSEPGKSIGKYTRRDETYVQVTRRTSERGKTEFGVTAGYTYKVESDVEIDIDGRKFTLFTVKDSAWAREQGDEAQLVAAMKAGSTMVVRGTSTRNTRTTDTYSLKGFTDAYKTMGKACGIN